ncbi:FtsQ-type POTRA domain-containing protein [Clostridium swellfunianum]|uniref:cell division protein FtsQ/DivIB n=1 Tax=Clostridium swellfunianum TaxID=1367462 RepID=UPI00202FDB78|nr:FtsQ-type POTRA domain-containing protein [Clostridium swellfunianum]MCM0650412.1 FtsQ-type POTRA domain-containing protein [Clostridium swellfunianum]
MRQTQISTNNELIIKRRQKRAIKRTVIFSVLLISVLVTLCLKLTYFNVSNIKIINNSIVNSDEIENMVKDIIGTNIFYLNLKNIRTNVLKNPYILKADIKRKLPNTIVVSVSERQAVFYGKRDNNFLIIDKNGIVLEEKDDISGMKLTSLEGFDLVETKLGEPVIKEDKRKINDIGTITELITLNTSSIEITSVNLSDSLNTIVKCNDISIKLGTGNIKEKLNLAFNIIENNDLKDQKGYIDVSFEGNPVVYIEK